MSMDNFSALYRPAMMLAQSFGQRKRSQGPIVPTARGLTLSQVLQGQEAFQRQEQIDNERMAQERRAAIDQQQMDIQNRNAAVSEMQARAYMQRMNKPEHFTVGNDIIAVGPDGKATTILDNPEKLNWQLRTIWEGGKQYTQPFAIGDDGKERVGSRTEIGQSPQDIAAIMNAQANMMNAKQAGSGGGGGSDASLTKMAYLVSLLPEEQRGRAASVLASKAGIDIPAPTLGDRVSGWLKSIAPVIEATTEGFKARAEEKRKQEDTAEDNARNWLSVILSGRNPVLGDDPNYKPLVSSIIADATRMYGPPETRQVQDIKQDEQGRLLVTFTDGSGSIYPKGTTREQIHEQFGTPVVTIPGN